MIIEKLEINIIYVPPLGGDGCNFYEYRDGDGYIDVDDAHLYNFWNIRGGLEIVVNGYLTLFRTTQFNFALEVTDFLMKTICMIKMIKLPDELPKFFQIPEGNIIDQRILDLTESLVTVEIGNANYIYISKINTTPYQPFWRYDRSFEKVAMDKVLWVFEARNALEDFFIFYKKVLDMEPDPDSDMYMNYLEFWQYIRENTQ